VPAAPEYCPNCSAPVPPRARACPECGADEKTGWSQAAEEDPLNLESDDFDYEEFSAREFGTPSRAGKKPKAKPLWWLVALILLIVFLFGAFLWR
jgi:hypothetical protein